MLGGFKLSKEVITFQSSHGTIVTLYVQISRIAVRICNDVSFLGRSKSKSSIRNV